MFKINVSLYILQKELNKKGKKYPLRVSMLLGNKGTEKSYTWVKNLALY